MQRHLLLFIFFLCGCMHLQGRQQFNEPCDAPWGIDSDLARFHHPSSPSTSKSPSSPTKFSTKVCTSMIRFFQIHISPIDGARSSYYPTSSQYALLAIQKYGMFKGIVLGCDRLMRENGEDWIYPLTHDYGRERKLDLLR